MTAVASKNLYDLLGNDIEDENDTPKPPTREIVKKTTSSKKADALPPKAAAPDSGRGDTRRPRGGPGNEAAFRDRGNGREYNRSRPTDEAGGLRERGDRPRGRGGRGGGRFDRHSATNRTDTDKQVSQGWGSNKGSSEWKDEQAGENIAQQEANAGVSAAAEGDAQGETPEGEAATGEAAPEPEPEDKKVSFAEYMAEVESRSPVESLPQARRANEGTRENKKWASAKELVKEEGEEYFAGSGSKQKNQKQRKEKQVVEIDQRFVDPRELRRGSGDNSGRGRGGGRGGSRGDRPPRGSGGGGAGGGRGEYRGGRGARGGGGLNVTDESAFPSLGSK